MANADQLQIEACANGLACLTERDLLIFIAQTLANNSGLNATQLLQNATTSGISKLPPREVLVIITQRASEGAVYGPNSLSGLTSWWKADSYTGLADNTVVGGPGLTWIDQRSGNNAVTGGGSVFYRTAGIAGGFPSLQYNGSSLLITPITLAGDFTIVVVGEATADTAWMGHSTLNQQIRFRRVGANVASVFPNGAPELISDAFSTTLGDQVATIYRRKGGTISFRENKTARNSGVNAGTFILDTLFSSPGAAVGGGGDCAEILVYSQNQEDTIIDKLYDFYLKPKRGLP